MSLIQPPSRDLLAKLTVAEMLWFQDLWNKLHTTQQQTNSALQVVGMTIQNNTPSGGQISWSACTLYYNGTAYPISAGNSGTNQFVWWVVGSNSFTSGNSFVPGPTIFPVLTNVAGVADITWPKLGAGAVRGAHTNFTSVY